MKFLTEKEQQKIAQHYERIGSDEGTAQAEAWYEKIIASFPDSKIAGVAEDQLVGMNVVVGRIAPDFEPMSIAVRLAALYRPTSVSVRNRSTSRVSSQR